MRQVEVAPVTPRCPKQGQLFVKPQLVASSVDGIAPARQSQAAAGTAGVCVFYCGNGDRDWKLEPTGGAGADLSPLPAVTAVNRERWRHSYNAFPVACRGFSRNCGI